MIPPSPDSIPTPKLLNSRSKEEVVIQQMQSELLNLVRVTPDESTDNWQQTPLRFGDWSGTLESEIGRFLW